MLIYVFISLKLTKPVQMFQLIKGTAYLYEYNSLSNWRAHLPCTPRTWGPRSDIRWPPRHKRGTAEVWGSCSGSCGPRSAGLSFPVVVHRSFIRYLRLFTFLRNYKDTMLFQLNCIVRLCCSFKVSKALIKRWFLRSLTFICNTYHNDLEN